jgi:tryptophanyl-tRNA synthetase
MALDDPGKKMSKSAASPASFIALTDTPDEISRKIKRAVTDSGSEIRASADKPAIANLLTIHSLLSGTSVAGLEAHFAGKGYGALKSEVAEVVITAVKPIQERLAALSGHPERTLEILAEGAERARSRAAAKIALVRDRMGIELRDHPRPQA